MNINKLIQSINRAKKIRRALPYHQQEISGVNVSDKELPQVLKTIMLLFKQFKLNEFDINISHWGEVILIEPYRQIKVILSVGYFEQDHSVYSVKKRLKICDYFDVSALDFNSRKLLIRIRAARTNTKWREHSFSDIENGRILAENFAEQIIEITSSLVSTTRFDPYKNFGQVTIEDVLAIARYGSALYGRETVLFFLVRDKEALSYPQKIIIDKSEMKITNFNGFTRSYLLNKKAIKLLGLLPINFEGEETIIER
ncbi:hypothetical protein H4J38_06645 [Colwellia sp. BRX10-3]|uniref:hypothetical protein n=1 Tax=Colwellia sp. BRX10-3 TaxID=2759844 RepID=UPI0015F56A7B|nr:hypothetical protein [Colwellia sp. BRX10-3]MBA6390460.1 hypothetical protein [Colwellia sp. BRX10-3]